MPPDTIERALGRNETRIEPSDDGLVFVKEIIGPTEDAERRYQNCVVFDREQSVSLPTIVSPPLLYRDDTARRLVYPYLTNAHSLQDELSDWAADDWAADHGFVDAVQRAAELLGIVHTLAPREPPPTRPGKVPLHEGPVRRFNWLTVDEYANASGGELGCWRLFHHDRDLQSAVTRWCDRQARKQDLVSVHGDIRPDQFLLTGDEMVILDWEEFGVGSRARDLAGVIGAIVFEVLRETFASHAGSAVGALDAHEQFLVRGAANLEAVGPAITGFIEAYHTAAGVGVTTADISADVGFYLLERVIGRSMVQATMRVVDRAIAGVARSVLLNPGQLSNLFDREM